MAATSVIGIDVGGTKILGGIIRPDGSVVRTTQVPAPAQSQEELLRAIELMVEDLLEHDPDVSALGFSVPSLIDSRDGHIVETVNLPLTDFRFGEHMKERFGLPVGVENDAQAAAISEWRAGAARGMTDMVMLTLGTGVGGALILGGDSYRGVLGTGGELGHMVIVRDGPPCFGKCTGRGHLEALASGRVADSHAKVAFGPESDARDLVLRAQQGNPKAIEILADMGDYLGCAFGSIVNFFFPQMIVVGGGFAAAGEFILGPAKARMRQEGFKPWSELVQVVQAELGVEAGIVGAGFVAYETLERAAVGQASLKS